LDALLKIVPIAADLLVKTLPGLLDAYLKVLNALVPLVEPILKIITAIADKLVAPAIIKVAKVFAAWVTDTAVPFINKHMPDLLALLDDFLKAIDKAGGFFEKFGLKKALGDFKANFVDPLIKDVQDGISEMLEGTWLGKQTDKIANALVKSVTNALIDPNFKVKAATTILELGTDPLGFIFGGDKGKPPGQALGSVALPRPGGQTVTVAEAGTPELLLPLERDRVAAVLEPLLPSIDMPGMDEAVSWLRRIHQMLSGTIKVEEIGTRAAIGVERTRERDDLGAALGFSGLSGGTA
jgi:hypothetical protein